MLIYNVKLIELLVGVTIEVCVVVVVLIVNVIMIRLVVVLILVAGTDLKLIQIKG
jgi:hypothetical protein